MKGYFTGSGGGSAWHVRVRYSAAVLLSRRVMRNCSSGGEWEGELVHTRRDGSQVVVVSRWSLQCDADGRPAASLESNNDISERKRAEDALRASEEQWKMVDSLGTVLSVNPFGADQLGYTVDELVGQSVLSVCPKAEWDTVRQAIDACLHHLDQIMSWEIRKVCRDGTVIWEEDLSAVKAAIEDLKRNGVDDLRDHLKSFPEFIDHANSRTEGRPRLREHAGASPRTARHCARRFRSGARHQNRCLGAGGQSALPPAQAPERTTSTDQAAST